MADLSPAAQAVMAAFTSNEVIQRDRVCRERIAAALHAAADQVVPANGSRRNNEIRADLLAIAAELKQADG
jgi:hypothetical protein